MNDVLSLIPVHVSVRSVSDPRSVTELLLRILSGGFRLQSGASSISDPYRLELG